MKAWQRQAYFRLVRVMRHVLHPHDGMPATGLMACEIACKSSRAFAHQVKGTMPDSSTFLSTGLFPRTGVDLKYVQ